MDSMPSRLVIAREEHSTESGAMFTKSIWKLIGPYISRGQTNIENKACFFVHYLNREGKNFQS